MNELPKQYDPTEREDAIYRKWEESGAFTADSASAKESYVISMPPPNATGELHIGHALFLTIQDTLIRYARMQGKEALWLPGTDHAAIATESVVIKKLQKEGMKNPRQELGREGLIEEIKTYVEKSRGTIRSQVRKMGSSCDWSRERYTMEDSLNRVVNEVFKKMHDDGVIYRGNRIVNWDPKLQTTVSDDEMEYVQEKSPFYTFKYGPFEISTARPETKFGDKYVVMHPDDARYAKYEHGDTFEAEWILGPVTATVIKDESVDPEFGTGVMTITPWHDATDFEIAERHGLDKEQIIGYDGKLLPVAGDFAGMNIKEVRQKIVDILESKGLLVGIDEDYVHNVALNSRGKGVIEPQIKLQWFIDVNKPAVDWKGEKQSLKQVMQDVVRSGDTKIYPKRFEKTYFNWIDNLKDWCISRQIWWGHRVPVWYKGDETYVGNTAPEGSDWQQDPDTLDTWFSSALWTWSTLIDPALTEDESLTLQGLLEKSPDYQKFHPTSVMETGYDIIFFWVARMILMTTYVTGQVPFKDVFLHGLVVSKSGKKMSKSDPSQAVDPLGVIEAYGADALRFGLLHQMNYGSQTVKLGEDAVRTGRNFANKVWNIARFLQQLPERDVPTVADTWIEERAHKAMGDIATYLEQYRFGEAMRAAYEFVWQDFADWYVEILKVEGSTKVARDVFKKILYMLHPFMPHVTEVLWEGMYEKDSLLMTQQWSVVEGSVDESVDIQMTHFKDVVSAVRSARALLDVPPKTIVDVYVEDALFSSDAFEALTRSLLTESKSDTMRRFPLASGRYISIGSDAITDASVTAATDKLEREQRSIGEFVEKQERALEGMRTKASPEIIEEKESILVAQKKRLEEITRSLSLLK